MGTSTLGAFEFVITLVLIITGGIVLISRRPPRRELEGGASGDEDLERIRGTVDELSGRLERLEKERDFYRDLLDAPGGHRKISPPEREEPRD
jgi:hypothetical protein